MPNWSTNLIVLRGKGEDIKNFLRTGIENSTGEKNYEGSVEEVLAHLQEVATVKVGQFPEEDKYKTGEPIGITYEKGLYARTFLPMPDTFILYDTTNNPEKYPEAVKEQRLDYGAVGWYAYNHKTLGCKWDFDFDKVEVRPIDDDLYALLMYCDTPWCMPIAWMQWIARTFEGIEVFIYGQEESDAYNEYGQVTESGYETIESINYRLSKLIPEDMDWDDEEACEKVWDAKYKLKDDFEVDFMDFIYQDV